MSDEHTHDWLNEREPEDRPSPWDERDLDVEYNPEHPEDREPDDESWRDEPEEEHDEESCTCWYGAYAKIGGGTGFDIAKYDPACPEHGQA